MLLNFQKPDKITMINASEYEGTFEFKPLEPGFGLTIGNALRRVLLSSLEGFAISSIKIEGVTHEFSSIKGVVEDVSEIILNLKQVRFKKQVAEINEEEITATLGGKKQVLAGDLQKYISNFQILNPDLVLFNAVPEVKVNMTINVSKGRGYVPADDNKTEGFPINTIFTDSIYTPIKNVKYSVENYRVEQKTDYEKLLFEVVTDGSISPKDAVTKGAEILIQHFLLVSDSHINLETREKNKKQSYDEEALHTRHLLKTKLVDMELSVRALNCLKAAEIDTLGDLVKFQEDDLMKFRNFGKKSLTEIKELIEEKKLSFGMDVSKYNLGE